MTVSIEILVKLSIVDIKIRMAWKLKSIHCSLNRLKLTFMQQTTPSHFMSLWGGGGGGGKSNKLCD